MVLPREQVLEGTIAEYASFEELLRSLDAKDWAAPTRCEGWTVADVAAHVTGTIADVAEGRFTELAAPDAPERQAAERRGRTAEQVADELHERAKIAVDIGAAFDDAAWAGPAPADLPGTLGEGVEALWYDTFVHGDDIRAAIGRASQPGPGLRAAVSHVTDILTQQGQKPATIALEGMPELAVSGGGGQRITGDPYAFVLAATGRGDLNALGLDDSFNIYR
jgi:uncharacterized protein (TIGR03083 family)